MALHDFDKAHAVHEFLLALLIAEPGGSENPAVLARVEGLCDAAVDAINDVESRVAMRGLKSLASLLYSADSHSGITAGALMGAEAVRFQMMNALSTFRGRIDYLERRRPSRPEVPAIASKNSLSVLVVEDNRDSADTLAKLLELSGYQVSIAYTAMDGLEAAKRIRPDVVLCDIGLPDSDGFALAEALRQNPITSSTRLIAVTAYGKESDRERSSRVGFALHLVKPVHPGALLHLLEELPKPAEGSADGQVVDMATARKPASGPDT
jgi:CheY-like chemotaxis protein